MKRRWRMAAVLAFVLGISGSVHAEGGGLSGLASLPSREKPTQAPAAEMLPAERAPRKQVTLMLYLCGSDLESEGGSATTDITEILHSGYNTEEVNVLAMVGGSCKWWGGFSTDETAIYELKGSRPVKVYSSGRQNMGEPATLTNLLEFCHEYYPADTYALDVWNHGGGPLDGVCWDSLAGSDRLSMEELQTALEDSFCSWEPLEWIGFDACLMASVETAHIVSPYARYMIASQETEPGCGWSYSFLRGIEEDADGSATGRRIVETYFSETPRSQAGQLTLSCIDLEKIGQVQERMDDFFSDLTVDLNAQTFSSLSNMRQGSRGFGRADIGSQDYDLVDLIDLVEHYLGQNPEGARALLEALSEAVVCADSTMDGSHGISVYHPYYNKSSYEEEWEEAYLGFSFSPGYTQYIQNFASIWLGESMGDWSQLQQPEAAAEDIPDGFQGEVGQGETGPGEEAVNTFRLPLTKDQAENYASAQMLVLEKIEIGSSVNYRSIYVSDEVTREGRVLTADYSGKALYALGEDGEALTGTLSYTVVDGVIRIPANFIKDGKSERAYTYYACRPVEGSDVLEVIGHYIYDEVSDQYTNRLSLTPSDYDEIYFGSRNLEPTYEGEELLPFHEWEKGDIVSAEVLEEAGALFHFSFVEEQLTDSQKYVTFQITDTQANVHSSALMPVANPNVEEKAVLPEKIQEGDFVFHASCQINSSKLSPYLALTLEIENQKEEAYQFTMTSMVLNGTQSRARSYLMYRDVEGGETNRSVIYWTPEELTNMERLEAIDCVVEAHPVGDYSSQPEIIRLHYTLDAEVGAIAARQEGKPLVTETGELRAELYALSELENGNLKAVLRWENPGEETQSMWALAAVNGHLLDSDAIHFDLPPGGVTWTYAEIYNQARSDYLYYTTKDDLLQGWGESEVGCLTLYNKENYNSYERRPAVKYDLPLSLPLALHRKGEADRGEKVLVEEQGLLLRLAQAEVYDGKLLLLLELGNSLEGDMSLEFPCDETAFDEAASEFYWDTFLLPSGTSQMEYLSFEPDFTEEEEKREFTFRIFRLQLDSDRWTGGSASYEIRLDLGEEVSLFEEDRLLSLERIEAEAFPIEGQET